jgi:hypothetical protein
MIKVFANGGGAVNGEHPGLVQALLAQDLAVIRVSGVAALTVSSGGSEGNVKLSSAVENEAVGSSDLADKTESEAAAATVKNALTEIGDKLNAYLTPLGLSTVVNSVGGTSADGTVAAVTASVAGAATGIQASNTNTYIAAVNRALYAFATKTNEVARALGIPEVPIVFGDGVDHLPALTTVPALTVNALGTAASPGVKKAAFDAVLVEQREAIKTICEKLNDFTEDRAPRVLAV